MTMPKTSPTSSESCLEHAFQVLCESIRPIIVITVSNLNHPTRIDWHVAAMLFTNLNMFLIMIEVLLGFEVIITVIDKI